MQKRILIVVKTYPNISVKYHELVCTAGITEDGEWIRLYPVDFRYQPYNRQFKKYYWIEVEVEKHTEDPRIESYRPNLETLKILNWLDPKDKWAKRKKIVFPLLDKSIEELRDNIINDKSGKSLGIIKPKEICNFVVDKVSREWPPKQKAIMKQQPLFGTSTKELDKIPYKFSYKFKCDDERCKGHKLMIEDWEIHELYRNCLKRAHEDENIAVKKVKQKYEAYIENNDLYFFVGTTRQKHYTGTFVIIGVFYPKK